MSHGPEPAPSASRSQEFGAACSRAVFFGRSPKITGRAQNFSEFSLMGIGDLDRRIPGTSWSDPPLFRSCMPPSA